MGAAVAVAVVTKPVKAARIAHTANLFLILISISPQALWSATPDPVAVADWRTRS
jgi:hypothetical protein